MRKEARQKARGVWPLSWELQVFKPFVDTKLFENLWEALWPLQKNVLIDLYYSFAYIFKGFVSKALLGLRIKPIGKGEPRKDFLMEMHGQVWKD